MKTDQLCQNQPGPPSDDGLTAFEALEFHRGWAAARHGDPFDKWEGPRWIEGWITYQWLKGQPATSHSRH